MNKRQFVNLAITLLSRRIILEKIYLFRVCVYRWTQLKGKEVVIEFQLHIHTYIMKNPLKSFASCERRCVGDKKLPKKNYFLLM